MNTLPFTDYFAPIPALAAFDETLKVQQSLPVVILQSLSSKQLRVYQLSQLDRADFFTYLIMGLAVLIAIIVPLLNLR